MRWIYLIVFFTLTNSIIAQEINCSDIPKYVKAFDFIQSDSININGKVKVSDLVVDLDRFYFKPNLKTDTILISVLDSLITNTWFNSFVSKKIRFFFNYTNKYSTKRILFFSLIEKNTLRADLFIDGQDLTDYDKILKVNRDKVYAYLFFFDKNGEIVKRLREEIIYEPY